jgi:uncharacterized protein YdeI (BOF family)
MNMKRLFPIIAMLNLAAGAALTAAGQSNRSSPSPQAQKSASPQLATFSGTVWQNGGKFVLRDESHRIWYQLDDQRWAARFEGDRVRVTGTLDASNNAIRVQNIEVEPVQSN